MPVEVAALPALSVAVAVQASADSVRLNTSLHGATGRDSLSVAAQASLAGPGASTVPPVFAPVTLTCGGTWSMLTGETTTVAMPPSWPWIVRLTICAAALRLSVTGPGHGPVSGADPAVQVNVTVTGERYQPNLVLGWALVIFAAIFGFFVAVEADDGANEASPL